VRHIQRSKNLRLVAFGASWLLCAQVSCRRDAIEPAQGQIARSEQVAAQPEPRPPQEFPKGRWRLAPSLELGRVVLWVSHILIRHEDTRDDGFTTFRTVDWMPDGPPPKRTRQEALLLSRRIAGELEADPKAFDRLVLEYSEDLSSRDRHGSLGGQGATQFDARILDALQSTAPGTPVGPVETDHGYHIFKQLVPPKEQWVAGEHIVIRYVGTFDVGARGPASRSRKQALELAAEILRSKESFGALVARYSEAPDRERGGSLGTWSTRAPGTSGREVELLSEMQVGEIAGPLDTPTGIQVLRRTEPVLRPTLAASLLELRYDPTAPSDDQHSRASSLTLAKRLAERLKADPNAFERLQREYCCADRPRQWTEGKGEVGLDEAVSQLRVGAIATEPISLDYRYVFAKRIATDPRQEPGPSLLELPRDATPNIEAIIRHSTSEALAQQAQALRSAALTDKPLSDRWLGDLETALKKLEAAFASAKTPDERVQAKQRVDRDLELTIGAAEYARYQRFMRSWVEQRVMDQPR
jgi:hypothetical protein